MVRAILDLEAAEPDTVDGQGLTALHLAATYGHADIVGALLGDPRCNPDIVSCGGTTALHAAADESRPDVVKMLVATGKVDVNRKRVSPFRASFQFLPVSKTPVYK